MRRIGPDRRAWPVCVGGLGEGLSGGGGHGGGGGVAVVGLFGQSGGDDVVHRGGDGVACFGGVWWWGDHVSDGDLFEGVAGVGRVAGEALVEHAGQGVDVGAGFGVGGGKAFGGHVGPGAQGGVGRCECGVGGGAGDAEVDEVGEVVVGQQDVGGFDVAVHQSALVGAV